MSIKQWNAELRPREKLLRRGASSLSDSELLAIFLGSGIKGGSAIELAYSLLKQTGGLRQLLNLKPSSLGHLKGLGPARYCKIQASVELAKRYLESNIVREEALESATQTKMFLRAKLRDADNEQFACLFLDNRHRLIEYEELFQGSVNCSSVHPRVVVQRALHHNAAALIVVHNHPSGVAEPSQADIEITRVLKKSLALIDVRLLDHFIVAGNFTISLAERGEI